MMRNVSTINSLRDCIREWRQAGQSIAFVPTMGNLHGGHIHLLTCAKQKADKVVVSIFVNPAQFGPDEDFKHYPRTEGEDQARLEENGADVLFLPSVAEMYPQTAGTIISVKALSTLHCGFSRPGHFDGVALVVCKFLNIVQPDLLLLGEKDFQQLTLLRCMIADLNLPVEIQSIATVREADGLAMSSRNIYLTSSQRRLAPMLYQTLCAMRDAILSGDDENQALIDRHVQNLQQTGFVVDYLTICRSADLLPASREDQNLVILLAAKLGATRLIDNIYFCRQAYNHPKI